MSRLLFLYFIIIVITTFGVNGHVQYVPCRKCLISHVTELKTYLENKEFCERCIPDYHNFDYKSIRQLIELLKEHKRNYNNPCTDFYEYMCGSWNIANSLFYSRWSTFSYNQYEIYYYYVKPLLEGEDKYDNLPFVRLAKRFYRSCTDEDALEKRGLEPMQRMLNATGGWPILMSEKEWNAKKYTWQDMDNDYFKLYNFFVLFDISYSNDDQHPGMLTINLSLQDPLNKLKINVDQSSNYGYKNTISVIRAFVKDQGIRIPAEKLREDVENLISFEKKLKNIIEGKKKNKGVRMTIAKLQKYYDLIGGHQETAKINWLDKIQIVSKLLNVNINASETILVFNKKTLHDLAYLLQATPQRVIVNYLQWHVVNTFMGNLNKQMRDVEPAHYYLYNVYDIMHQQPRWLRCINEFYMKDALFYLYTKTYMPTTKVQAVHNIFEDIKEEMMDYIESSTWLNKLTKDFIIQKIYNVSLNVGHFDWYDNQTALTQMYEGLEIDDNYFTNVLAIIKYQNKIKQKSFYKSELTDENLNRWSFDFLYDRPSYDEQSNVINIPAVAIKYPYFEPGQPSAVNYGGIGAIIGQLLARCVNLYLGSYLDDNGNVKMDTKIRQAYETRLQCSLMPILNNTKQYQNFMLNITHMNPKYIQMYGDLIRNESIAYFTGTQIAFSAFQRKKSALLELSSDDHNTTGDNIIIKDFTIDQKRYRVIIKNFDSQPKRSKTSLTKKQMFFLFNMRVQCGKTDPYDQHFTINNNDDLINIQNVKAQINSNLANMEAFSRAFNCPKASPMNSILKCKSWNEMSFEEYLLFL